jgi:hypothetical protein
MGLSFLLPVRISSNKLSAYSDNSLACESNIVASEESLPGPLFFDQQLVSHSAS